MSGNGQEGLKTNRDAFREGVSPCEWEPYANRLSLLSDIYHGIAIVKIYHVGLGMMVCDECAKTLDKA